MSPEKIIPLNNEVSWIGVRDKEILTFDIVMETLFGTSYNSYFIAAEKKTVIDTVKETFQGEFLEKISELCNPSEIQYIVCNHTEPDHSGSLKGLLELAPDATVVGSGQALSYLSEMINIPFKSMKVKDGDSLDLGNKNLQFIGAANLHWPDSMYTYLREDKLLFTCDSFGAHFCHDNIFDDEIDDYRDAFRYYFDVILKPYSKFMLKAIEKIENLDLDMICPGHGPILRSAWKARLEETREFSLAYLAETDENVSQILIAYVSAYGFTKKMAFAIARGIQSVDENLHVEIVDIEKILLGDLEEKIVRAGGLLVGSPTINKNTLLPVYKLFSVINPLRDKGKLAASFGSYGWSGEAVELIENHLRNLRLEIVQNGIATKFLPNEDQTAELMEFGKTFGLRFIQNPA